MKYNATFLPTPAATIPLVKTPVRWSDGSAMVEEIPGEHRVTLGADKGYDRKEFVQELRDHQVTPHIACKQTSIIDARTTRHPVSQSGGGIVAPSAPEGPENGIGQPYKRHQISR